MSGKDFRSFATDVRYAETVKALKKPEVIKCLAMQGGNELVGSAPDLNPDELVWSHAKRTGVARNPLRKGASMEQRVTEQLKTINQNPSLERAFFRHPSVPILLTGE